MFFFISSKKGWYSPFFALFFSPFVGYITLVAVNVLASAHKTTSPSFLSIITRSALLTKALVYSTRAKYSFWFLLIALQSLWLQATSLLLLNNNCDKPARLICSRAALKTFMGFVIGNNKFYCHALLLVLRALMWVEGIADLKEQSC